MVHLEHSVYSHVQRSISCTWDPSSPLCTAFPPPGGKTHETVATIASMVCQILNWIDLQLDCKVPSSTEARNSIGHGGARAIQMRKLANATYAIGDGPRPSKELRQRTRTLLALAVEASTCALERVDLCAVLRSGRTRHQDLYRMSIRSITAGTTVVNVIPGR